MTAPYASPGLCRKRRSVTERGSLQIVSALRLLLTHAELRPRLDFTRASDDDRELRFKGVARRRPGSSARVGVDGVDDVGAVDALQPARRHD
jgi:hypothetical protein